MSNEIDLESLRTAELKEAFDEFDKVPSLVGSWYSGTVVCYVLVILVSCIQKKLLAMQGINLINWRSEV